MPLFRFQLLFLFVLGCCCQAYGQGKGVIYGVVTDRDLGEGLAFVNIGIAEQGIGTTSDVDGRYRLVNVPAGTHQVDFSYLGYATETAEVTVGDGEEVELDMVLYQEGMKLEEVIVKAQATGQKAAINQQINSNTIVNVVSKEKLQELPDQNAAEAVGRLAGVSVYRDAGEGQRISVRGISPRFNAITINGERLPSTEESERSVDLSMISPEMLSGIELFKAITPDMDGDAVGGTVNFTVRKADDELRTLARVLGGYNGLKNDFAQLRTNFSISDRVFKDRLGIVATGNFQRANRSNEFVSTSYVFEGRDVNEVPILSVDDLNLGDKLETRIRYGGSLTLDYQFDQDHSLLLSSNLGRTERDELRYRRRYRLGNNYQEFDVQQRERQITLLANTLSGEHHFKNFELTWRSSYSFSNQDIPYRLRGRFRENAAISGSIENDRDLTQIPNAFKNNLENTILRDVTYESSKVDEDRLTSQVDLRYNFTLRPGLSGYLKAGGKYRQTDRRRTNQGSLLRPYLPSDNPALQEPELFVTNPTGQILMANFMGSYTNDNFFDGRYDLLPGTPELRSTFTTTIGEVDIDAYNQLFGTDYQLGDEIPYRGHLDMAKVDRFYRRFRSEFLPDLRANSEDYDGSERILASYLMGELNIGKKLTLLGGLRYEETDQEYTSVRIAGNIEEEEFDPSDLIVITNTAGRTYHEFLPMAHVKYRAADWMDIRAAVTKTLARPNFFNIVPWEFINTSEQELSYGNPELLHTTAWNYDLFLSFYNRFGLFTVGGFYKQLRNIDYIGTTLITDPESDFRGFSLTEPRNVSEPSTVLGVEFDLQANLSSLSGFWRGIVLGANLTLAESETFYPLFNVETIFVGPPTFFETVVTDTLRSGPIVGQADVIANLTLGYEIGRFSGRISMVYQSDALSPGNPGIGSSENGVGEIPEKDFFDKSFTRFDVALKQGLDKRNRWTLVLNLNNLTNTPEQSFLGIADRLRDDEFYGMTAEFGLMFKM